MHSKTALITGITGQDGSYLAEFLLTQGYEVHGLVRRTSMIERSRLKPLFEDKSLYRKRLHLHYADLDDPTTIRRVLTKIQPSEVYHLAGQSHVGLSFEIPESTCELTAMGTLRLLEMLRDLPAAPRVFHAASSEIFGNPKDMPQTEETALNPSNPYACAKAFAVNLVRVYRDAFSLHAVNGILYNHESPRRGEGFVTRKICRAAARIAAGLEDHLSMGDISGQRDWGYAPDYVKGMWLSLQHDFPEDYIFATGKLHSVQDVLEVAFSRVGLDWQTFYRRDERFIRPSEPTRLIGDPSKAEKMLGWKRSVTFVQMIEEMVDSEVQSLTGNE
jgi:GDPmannose 4,6-dehydratase